MSHRTPPLTRSQKNDLLLMGEREGFKIEKAARVLGFGRGEKLKELINRESPEFIAAVANAFPGHFCDDDKDDDWGPRQIDYKDIGRLSLPDSLVCLAIRKPWNRSLGLQYGA